MDNLIKMISLVELTQDTLLLLGVGIGVSLLFFGLVVSFSGPSESERRMRAPGSAMNSGAGVDILNSGDGDPTGLLKVFVPTSHSERTKVGKLLRQAGKHSKYAVRNYYLTRTVLGIVLPLVFVSLVFLPEEIAQRLGVNGLMDKFSSIHGIQILALLVVVGYFGPAVILRQRIRERRKLIENALPNALDLLQVAIEAGMGFDAAMARVANELAMVSPEISDELKILQMEIQAGKTRERAFLDMAERTGVEEVRSFLNVIIQSMQFGTSVSDALKYFSEKMREDRELRAHEMANKLPVKMSGIMAGMMMPTLLMITVGPVVIRWIRMMG